MNRLALIGNGFDLAHGLKTSYRDFMNWYMCDAYAQFYEKKYYSDRLIEIKNRYSSIYYTQKPSFKSCEDVIENISRNEEYQTIQYKSNFFQTLQDKITTELTLINDKT